MTAFARRRGFALVAGRRFSFAPKTILRWCSIYTPEIEKRWIASHAVLGLLAGGVAVGRRLRRR